MNPEVSQFCQERLVCPLDHGELNDRTCSSCNTSFGTERIGERDILDLRGLSAPSEKSIELRLPIPTMPKALRDTLLTPRSWRTGLLSREELRQRYGTKLSVGFQHHVQELLATRSRDLTVLDLGCGSGGNVRYLADQGITSVVAIDWWSDGAEVLADAHRLPFRDQTFDVVLATAVLEHCYMPHVAMREVARVLVPGGTALIGASFWESWHGESFFHFTPNGIYALCDQAGLDLADLWSGWGFIPAVLSHAVSSRLKQTGYRLQTVWDKVSRYAFGREAAYTKMIRTSGSLQFRADRRPIA